MSLTASAIILAERTTLPDLLLSVGIDRLVRRTHRLLADTFPADEAEFVASMSRYPISASTDAANSQHYELPPSLFTNMLGPRLKYSCCLFETTTTSLAEAELAALDSAIAYADLADGQEILEWGCGWGSLTLYTAERFQNARILAVTNSRRQREFILTQAAAKGLANVEVQRADMNDFETPRKFDRLVSIEMFEHMSNWRALLSHARDALARDGKMFLHVFNHRSNSYRFDVKDPNDWIARHFFTGGMMPAQDLPHRFTDLFEVKDEWQLSGMHYKRTAQEWLKNFDAHRSVIDPLLVESYGRDSNLWRRRWRLFLLATIGLFGHAEGSAWGIGQYRLAPVW